MMFIPSARMSHLVPRRSAILLGLVMLGSTLALGGCGHEGPPDDFPPANYDYLPLLNLNAATLQVIDQSDNPTDSTSLIHQSPTPPARMLDLMARQRLHLTGNTGTAVFTIRQITLTAGPHHALSGTYVVKLALNNTAQNHHGTVTARVTRTITPSGKVSRRHALYDLNRQIMDDMNVEMEYQIRRHLADWMTDATGAPLNGAIQSQSLDGMADTPTASALPSPPGVTPVAPSASTPSATRPAKDEPARIHSPPPGVLHLP